MAGITEQIKHKNYYSLKSMNHLKENLAGMFPWIVVYAKNVWDFCVDL
jgi:hypothetical protein